jgi:ribosome-binding protein aMBF1 (putative translation factor)
MVCGAYGVDTARGEGVDVATSGWAERPSRDLPGPEVEDVYEATRFARRLGRSVRNLRDRQGWTQTELARVAGMTQPAVARFEAGGTVPTIPVLDRLARALGADLVVELRNRSAGG